MARRWTLEELGRVRARGLRDGPAKPKKLATAPLIARNGQIPLSAYFPGIPGLVLEYRFHPTRRFRFDVSFPQHKLAIEQQGGIWTRGRHTRGKGYLADMEKVRLAVMLGWRVLPYPPELIRDGTAAADVRQLIDGRR